MISNLWKLDFQISNIILFFSWNESWQKHNSAKPLQFHDSFTFSGDLFQIRSAHGNSGSLASIVKSGSSTIKIMANKAFGKMKSFCASRSKNPIWNPEWWTWILVLQFLLIDQQDIFQFKHVADQNHLLWLFKIHFSCLVGLGPRSSPDKSSSSFCLAFLFTAPRQYCVYNSVRFSTFGIGIVGNFLRTFLFK